MSQTISCVDRGERSSRAVLDSARLFIESERFPRERFEGFGVLLPRGERPPAESDLSSRVFRRKVELSKSEVLERFLPLLVGGSTPPMVPRLSRVTGAVGGGEDDDERESGEGESVSEGGTVEETVAIEEVGLVRRRRGGGGY